MKSLHRKLLAIIIMSLLMGFVVLPKSYKEFLPDWLGWFKNQDFHLGLDLQGGVQLEYKVDLTKAREQGDVNIDELVEGSRNIIERRVNALGVSEPQIQVSNMANEKRIIVELAGIDDTDKAKELIGKPVMIEFKEPKDEAEEDQKEEWRQTAESVLKEVTATGADFAEVGLEQETLHRGEVIFNETQRFQDELSENESFLWDSPANSVHPEIVEENISLPNGQSVIQTTTFSIYKVLDKNTVERDVTEPGEDFQAVAQEVSDLKDEIDLTVNPQTLPENIQTAVLGLTNGEMTDIIETDNYWEIYKRQREILAEDKVSARHILISYAGAERAPETVTRTQEEAEKLAQEVLTKATQADSDFGALAQEFSDEPGAQTSSGNLGFFGKGVMARPFENAAYELEVNQVSEVVETIFGYHIIQKTGEKTTDYQLELARIAIDKNREIVPEELATASGSEINAETASGETIPELEAPASYEFASQVLERLQEKTFTRQEEQLSIQTILFLVLPDPWQDTGLTSEQFEGAKIAVNSVGQPYLIINFNDEGKKLFADITERNVGQPVAIFVGGELVSAPNVREKIDSGSAQITRDKWPYQEVAELKMLLDAGNFPAPLILKGEYTIGATLGEESLQKSIYAALLGLLILAIYMIVYYRLMGIFANISLAIYAIIILFILKSSGTIGIPIVMTLAGVAGFVLSIGMAVDANVLIFERIKEELKSGKNLSAAIQIGFERAWTSIRDSNLSTILTCIVLAWFGSSIIRGFAITLAIGVLVSMFSAITITRTFLQLLVGSFAEKAGWLFSVKRIKSDFRYHRN